MDVSCPGCMALQRRVTELTHQVEHLTRQLEELRRAGKRQAAPFAKGPPQSKPKRPGRKAGADYGAKAHRPPPQKIDEVLEAPLPDSCPQCGGTLEETHIAQQY